MRVGITGMVRRLAAVLVVAAPLAAQQSATVTVSGVGYLHYRYQLDTDSSLASPARRNNFEVDRSYITLSARLPDGVAARITTDIDRRAANSNQQTFRLKYAYAAWTPEGSALTWKLGMIQTPVIEFLEQLWDYRMQGPVALDRQGVLTSSDIGLSVQGAWGREQVSVAAGVFNGEGYSRAPGEPGKDVAARVSVRLAATDTTTATSGLRATGYLHYGKANGGGTRLRMMGLLSYQTRRLTVGAEYTVTRDSTGALSPETAGSLASTYAVYRLGDGRSAVLARYDRHDPDTDTDPTGPSLATGVQQRVIVGASHWLTRNLRVLLDADLLSLEHGSPDNAFNANRRTLYFHTEFRF